MKCYENHIFVIIILKNNYTITNIYLQWRLGLMLQKYE